ncbi:MAG: hypothetical protein N2037_04815 [Acidimicrobiales bacterium]|nr:hypothetical protein [Acidimicrobiales bacterium]
MNTSSDARVSSPRARSAKKGSGEARTFPFTPLEDAIVHSERQGFPITIELQVDLAGRIDGKGVRRAIREAQRIHPLAACRRRFVAAFDRVQQWEFTDTNDVEAVTFSSLADAIELEAARDQLLSERIPLECAPLFRVLHARLPDHDALLFSVHHGAFDGIGCLAFLRSIAASYGGRSFDESEAEAICRTELNRRRDAGPVVSGERREGLRAYVEPVRSFARSPRTARVAPSRPRGADGYGITHRSIRLAAGRSMLETSYHPDATANDVLVAALHLAIAEWNLDHGVVDDEIGVTVPVSGRLPTERAQIVANLTRQGATVSTRRDRSDPRQLLESIRAQTARLKREGGNEPAAVLGSVSFIPAPVRRRLPSVVSSLTRDRFVDTSRLSNLGRYDPLEFSSPGFQVDRLWFSPPVRMPQGLTVGTVSLGESLYLSFRWCRALFDHAAAGHFADLYLDAINRLTSP